MLAATSSEFEGTHQQKTASGSRSRPQCHQLLCKFPCIRLFRHRGRADRVFQNDNTAWRTNNYGSPMWIKPRRIEPPERSGATVHSNNEIVDTGDRRTVFGYTARRVITKNTSRRDSELASESESDGWYIDAPPAWLRLHPPAQQDARSPPSIWRAPARTRAMASRLPKRASAKPVSLFSLRASIDPISATRTAS